MQYIPLNLLLKRESGKPNTEKKGDGAKAFKKLVDFYHTL